MKCYCFIGRCHVGQNKRTGKERAGVAMGRSGNLQPDTVSTGKFPTSMQFQFGGRCLQSEGRVRVS